MQVGLPRSERTARRRTHSWCCWVSFHCPRVKNSRVHRHSPLNEEARICAGRPISMSLAIRIIAIPTNLCASSMSQVIPPFSLKSQMVISMHHLVRQRILQMPLIPQLIRANPYPIIRIKASRLSGRTSPASYVAAVYISIQLCYVLSHEADDRACRVRFHQ